ncbi:MAG: hypothetical protein ACC707_02570 [Thiohalomonadales bacterium]
MLNKSAVDFTSWILEHAGCCGFITAISSNPSGTAELGTSRPSSLPASSQLHHIDFLEPLQLAAASTLALQNGGHSGHSEGIRVGPT